MKVTFKVIDTRTGKDITNSEMWCLRPDGSLQFNDYGDLVGLTYARPVFTIEELNESDEQYYLKPPRDTGINIEACDTCKYFFACDEENEFYCKQNNYSRHCPEDEAAIAMLLRKSRKG